MATTLISNLYPPVLQSTLPGFINTEECIVPLELSNYNSVENIQNVQVTLKNQLNNKSMLNTTKYPSGIKICNLLQDASGQYYIVISPKDLIDGKFGVNQYYKIQMRFTSTLASSFSGYSHMASWLSQNLDNFSEWSTVCIIRGISKPTLSLSGITIGENGWCTITTPILRLNGSLSFVDTAESDMLKNYQIKVYDETGLYLISDSGIITSNSLDYSIPYLLAIDESSKHYQIKISYTTTTLYTATYDFGVNVNIDLSDSLAVLIEVSQNEDNGCIDVLLTFSDDYDLYGNLIIQRSCSLDDYKEKTIIYTISANEAYTLGKTILYQDITAESGVWYKYAVTVCSSNEGVYEYTQPVESDPVMVLLGDAYLIDENIQLKLPFNLSISSIANNAATSITTTLGSKYPFYSKNGNVDYKTFSISGLISRVSELSYGYQSIEDSLKRSSQEGSELNPSLEIYAENKLGYTLLNETTETLLKTYNSDNNINEYYDYIYEKIFRDKVYDFLTNGKIKLFKSQQEGNILVVLTDINFTPEENTDRRIYNFSATATEVDDNTFDKYKEYNIVGTEESIEYEYMLSIDSQDFINHTFTITNDYTEDSYLLLEKVPVITKKTSQEVIN